MAAAEARAAWRRSANCCFVQEDAKWATKLAHCSSSFSGTQCDSGSGDTTNELDYSAQSFMPVNWNIVKDNLPPDTKWWLQLQPNFGYEKEFAFQQLKGLKDESKSKETEGSLPSCKLSDESGHDRDMEFDTKKYDEFSFESSWMVTSFMHENIDEETKTMSRELHEPPKHKMEEEFLYRDELIDADPLISKKPEKLFPDTDLPWARDSKSAPWWRTTDKEDLALLVAKNSPHYIDNCDLPKPSKSLDVAVDPYACFESVRSEGIFSMSAGQKPSSDNCSPVDVVYQSYTSESFPSKYTSSSEVSRPYDSKIQQSRTNAVPSEGKKALENNSSNGLLLEALRHAQTRAREAEVAAQKACNEKEHVLKLLFKQASHLFAYKQWMHILQLETLCLQLKFKENQISEFLTDLPWIPLKSNPTNKDRRKGKKPNKFNFCRSAVFVAVGLGLAGAGLFFGWTLGWFSRCF